MTKLIDVQRAFLAGIRHGSRLAHKQTRHDIEELMDELHAERDDVARYQNIITVSDLKESQE